MSPIYHSPETGRMPHKEEIIVIGDQPVLLDSIQESGLSHDYKVTKADSFTQAENQCQSDEVIKRVIIIDQYALEETGFSKFHYSLSSAPQECAFVLAMDHYDSMLSSLALNHGIFFFLIKPYSSENLRTTIESALSVEFSLISRINQLDESQRLPALIEQASFNIRTPNEAKTIAAMLGYISPTPNKVSLGLFELMLNAIEHGNLGISYEEKSELIASGKLQEETIRRLDLPENKDKTIHIELAKTQNHLIYTIHDQGPGFDYHQYLNFSQKRGLDKHGRGIMIANKHSFDELDFEDGGATAICKVCFA